MKNILKTTLVLFLVAGLSTGCEDFLNPSVDQAKPIDTAINTVDDLQAFVFGMHAELNNTALFGRDLLVSPSVMSDDAFSNGNSGRFISQSQFNFTVNNGYALNTFEQFYQIISNANIVINTAEIAGTAKEDYVRGQAYGIRALSYTYLVLHFGQQYVDGGTLGVPIITEYNNPDNLYPTRNTADETWAQIVSDLEMAATLMGSTALDAGTTQFGYNAVKALQSRVYLFTGDFDEAIAAANVVRNSGDYALVASANFVDAWGTGSGPAPIFSVGFNTDDRVGNNSIARIYRPTNYGDVEATVDLYDAYDPADVRLQLFTRDVSTTTELDTVRMVGKYTDELGEEDVKVIRYAEVLLNRAEALARRGTGTDLTTALGVINSLSTARGSATVYNSVLQADVIQDVLAERRLELAMEGQRLFDLARHRMDIPNVAVDPVRGTTLTEGPVNFGNYRFALPIPQDEMDANSSMTQNEGYD